MTRKKSLRTLAIQGVALYVLVGALAMSGCGKSGEKIHEPAFLLVQSSQGFSYDGDRLTVHGTSPTTTYFSDRPDRIAGHMSLEDA